MSSRPSKPSKKSEQAAAADTAIDNATLANMLAELRADLLSKPDSLAVRFENNLRAIDTKLDGIQSMVTDHEQRISDLESGPHVQDAPHRVNRTPVHHPGGEGGQHQGERGDWTELVSTGTRER